MYGPGGPPVFSIAQKPALYKGFGPQLINF